MLGHPQPPQPDPGGPVPSQFTAHGSPAGGWGRFPRMRFMWTQSCGVPSRLVSQDWGGSPKGSRCTRSLLEQSPREVQGQGPLKPVSLRVHGPAGLESCSASEGWATSLSGRWLPPAKHEGLA